MGDSADSHGCGYRPDYPGGGDCVRSDLAAFDSVWRLPVVSLPGTLNFQFNYAPPTLSVPDTGIFMSVIVVALQCGDRPAWSALIA